MTQHKHRAATKQYPHDDRERRRHDGAHGGLIEIRRCSCGAEQRVEVNDGRRNAGPWVERTRGQVRALDITGVIRVRVSGWKEVDIMVPIDPWRALRRASMDPYLPATIELEDGEVAAVTFDVDGDSVTAEVV